MWPGKVKRPSEALREVLTGKVAMADADPGIQSWAQFTIYQGAKEVLALPTKGERRNALGRIPATVRPYVEAEIKRLWALR